MPRGVLSHYAVHQDLRVLVTDDSAPADSAAILGTYFWDKADDDYNLGSNQITLVRPNGCSPGDTLPFNGGTYSQTPLLNPFEYRVTVTVDGVSMQALVDTGASTTIMTRQGASKLSHVWPLPNAQPQGQYTVANQRKISWAKAQFKSFSIGQETLRDPLIEVVDLYQCDQPGIRKPPYVPVGAPSPPQCYNLVLIPDMILGADFFHAHHVLISNSRRMMYFSYNAGAAIFR